MRIGFDATVLSLNRAGEARYARGLLGGLGRRTDLDVVNLTLSRRVPGRIEQRLAYQAITEGLYLPLALPRQARRAGADVIHHPRLLVPREFGRAVPSVVTAHDVLALSMPQYFSGLIASRFRALAPAAVRRADVVVTATGYNRRELVEHLGISPDRIRLTRFGIEDRFTPRPPGPEWLAARFGIDRPYVLCVGTIEPRKNLAGVLAAFDSQSGFGGDVALVVVGGRGWKTAAIDEALRRSSTRLVQTGYVDDDELVRLYSGAECFAFPSFAEGFGFPVLEAMACGAPVVTSDRTSLPEVAGDAAVLVDPDSPEAIGAAIAELLGSEERRADLRERGLRRSAAYTWDGGAEDVAAVYREVARYPSGPPPAATFARPARSTGRPQL